MANNNKQDLKLNIDPEVAKGMYSNLAVISHTPAEIVVDFAQLLPGSEGANIRSRVIMHPIHAKRLLSALADNIQRYEHNFGTITEPMLPAGNGDTVPYDILGKA